MPVEDGLGTYVWTKRTSGVMSSEECRRAFAAVVLDIPEYLVGRIRLLTGRMPRDAAALSFTSLTPPDSRLAGAAEEACAEQRPHVVRHSYRTWAYGHALALLDEEPLDVELFYVACLLHDYGLEQPQSGEDFTLRSAERALQCVRTVGASEHAAGAVADAVTLHVTPGIRSDRHAALGYYVQAGSLLDLAGFRAWDLPRAYCDAAAAKYPREGVTGSFVNMVRARLLPTRAAGSASCTDVESR